MCMFKVVMLESIVCEDNNCDKRIDNVINGIDIGLNVEDTIDTQTEPGLLSNLD